MARLAFGLALLAGACSDSVPPNADLDTPGGNSSSSSSSGSATPIGGDASVEGGASDGGEDAEVADAANDAHADAEADAGLPPPPPSTCKPTLALGTAVGVTGVTGATPRFAGVSSDELTIAWIDNGTLEVADRTSKDGSLGVAQALTGVAADQVALSSFGLDLVAIGSNRQSVLLFTRADRTQAFEPADASDYQPIVDALTTGETLGDLVFIHSNIAVVYSVFGGGDDTVHYATRISEFAAFSPDGPLGFPELRAQNGQFRHPTGVEDDFQTMFYWDDVTSSEKLAHTNGTSNVIGVEDLAAHPNAQASGACERVYFGSQTVSYAPTN